MKIIYNDVLDPYFNLASEEYLLSRGEDEIFMLWRNAKSVIIGKNQNAYAELDLDFVKNNNIKVVRRLTGGGAVFHDDGNVNFTFIAKETNDRIDFEKYTLPVIKALKGLSLENVYLSGRNDILLDGQKVSGNAQCHQNGKILHHGTLLFSADISKMAGALRVDEQKIKSKGIKSVKSRVTNIKDHLENDMDAEKFLEYLLEYAENEYGTKARHFTEQEKKEIGHLSDTKYSTWEWNFGQSKTFEKNTKKRFEQGTVELSFTTEQGIITQVKINGDFFGTKDISALENLITGQQYELTMLGKTLEKNNKLISECIMGMDSSKMLELF